MMAGQRCLYCYQLLLHGEPDFHPACSKAMFGGATPPVLPYSENELDELAAEVIRTHTTVTGVQPKLSLHITGARDTTARKFTIVGLWGDYILKPPTAQYRQLPEAEDLTMHLASLAKIQTVPHSLIRMQTGNLAYITKRIDRKNHGKIHMEDMCQLTGRLTEDKYHGSYEQVAKAIWKFSARPGLDVVNFYEIVLFSFLTGNADMHLKNFSLITQPRGGMILSSAYDLIATKLVNPVDPEELALTLNGKKNRITKNDFITAFTASRLQPRQQDNIFKKMWRYKDAWRSFIQLSFLSTALKNQFFDLLEERFSRIK